MTVNYTTNLSLGQPVTGTESGTWGDDVNNAVTSYLDIAIAGGLAITITTTDVTLSITQGTSSATNIGSTTAQYAILNVSGAMTAARNLIVPSSSRIYLINNNTTGGFALTVKGSATSGVTLVNGEKAHVFWNGTDYAKLSNASGGAGVFSSITNSGLTSGRVVYSTTGGLETDSANLTFNGTTLTANTIGAFTLGGTIAGGGNQINNVIIGTTTPVAGAFTTLSATGVATFSAGSAAAPAITTTGDTNTGIFFPAADTIAFAEGGAESMRLDSSGNLGLGVTPSAWSGLKAFEFAGVGSSLASAANNNVFLSANAWYNGTNWRYGITAAASQYQSFSGQHAWFNAPSGTAGAAITFTQAMTLDASGNLAVGTTTAITKLTVNGSDGITMQRSTANAFAPVLDYIKSRGTTASPAGVSDGDGLFLLRVAPYQGSAYTYLNAMTIEVDGTYTSGQNPPTRQIFYTNAANGSAIARVTIDSSGNLLVGTTSTGFTNSRSFTFQGVGDGKVYVNHSTANTNGDGYIGFGYNGSQIGSITQSGTTAVAYNTSSDYRLKNITGPITTSGAYIDSLNPVEGTWKADGSTFVGLIAHEVQEASRTNVATGVKDGSEMQAMDYSSAEIIANLIAELQSLRRRVAQLESKL